MIDFNNLLECQLEGVENKEIMLSKITVPPNTSLPKHWHPGEEFAYILEGSLILWQEGEEDMIISKGEAGVVPLKKTHTIRTREDGATALVFRVHEKGLPERYLAE